MTRHEPPIQGCLTKKGMLSIVDKWATKKYYFFLLFRPVHWLNLQECKNHCNIELVAHICNTSMNTLVKHIYKHHNSCAI